MTHTPGPWHLGGISNPMTNPRTSVWGPTPVGAQSGEWIAKDVTLPNAHLIATAPALLAACKRVVARLEDALLSVGEMDDVEWLRAVIAVAEGGAQAFNDDPIPLAADEKNGAAVKPKVGTP